MVNMGQQTERVYWQARFQCITAISAYELAKKVNEFCSDLFVISTQAFPAPKDGQMWTALIFYKVKE